MTHFINASGETIPPFACMQICIPPKDWEKYEKEPITNATKQMLINGGLVAAVDLPRYEQDTVLYCCKPNLVTSVLQDASTLAFNGPSYVAAGKQGVCTIGEYPAKGLASAWTYPYAALGPAPNSWRLWLTFKEYGAFRGLYPTLHEIKKDVTSPFPNESAPRFVQFIGQNNHRQARIPMQIRGDIKLRSGDNQLRGIGILGEWLDRFRSEDEFYFEIHRIPTTFGTLTDGKSAWFNNGRIEWPAVYEFQFAGRLAVKDAPSDLTTVPVNLKLRFDPDDGNNFGFPTEIRNGDIAININKYTETQVPLVQKWPEVAFRTRFFVYYTGKKGRFVYENKSSPYVQLTNSEAPLSFEVRRVRLDLILRRYEDNFRSDIFFRPVPANPFFGTVYYTDSFRNTEIMFFET